MMIFIFSVLEWKYLFWKNDQSCCKFLFKLFNLIMSSFYFDKLVEIPKNILSFDNYIVPEKSPNSYLHILNSI